MIKLISLLAVFLSSHLFAEVHVINCPVALASEHNIAISAVSPKISLGNPMENARRIFEFYQLASARESSFVVFPELSLTGYSLGDLFHQGDLIKKSKEALKWLVDQTRGKKTVLIVGAPYLASDGRYYNTAFVIAEGKVLGAVPKTHLPNYHEFYEKRYFTSGRSVNLEEKDPQLGTFRLAVKSIFMAGKVSFAIEICEDAWAPMPPSWQLQADVVFNLSASNELVAKAEFRKRLVQDLSLTMNNTYVYVGAGAWESTTDLVFGGHVMIAHRGRIIKEGERFSFDDKVVDYRATAPNQTPAENPVQEMEPVLFGQGKNFSKLGFERIVLLDVEATEADIANAAKESRLMIMREDVEAYGIPPHIMEQFAKKYNIALIFYRPLSRAFLITPDGETRAIDSPEVLDFGDFRLGIVKGGSADHFESSLLGLSNAHVILHLGGEWSDLQVEQQSARLNAGYIYINARKGASVSPLWVVENGNWVAKVSKSATQHRTNLDFDIDKLKKERMQNTTWASSASIEYPATPINVSSRVLTSLYRYFPQSNFVPSDPHTLQERTREIFEIQTTGLMRRLLSIPPTDIYLGLSGGSDSTLAFLVMVNAHQRLNRDMKRIKAISMPGFGTSSRTREQASSLAALYGVSFEEKDIRPIVLIELMTLKHPLWEKLTEAFNNPLEVSMDELTDVIRANEALQDLVFENVQARARTSLLMNSGLTIGTGDLSELALGWCTFNGDHMSMYGVNAGIPKTLVKHVIGWIAKSEGQEKAAVLGRVLGTTVSPELRTTATDGSIKQDTEENIGPYILHDFFLYHYLRNRFDAEKIYTLAKLSFARGDKQFTAKEIKHWLKVFYRKFYTQQYKRTVLPSAPKVGSVSLSPRGDWRMPDEAEVQYLLAMIDGFEE